MAQSKQLQEIITLGKKLVTEFSADEARNTTLKWMGNYIAQLIVNTENELDPVKKKVLEKECADTIIKLWEKRENLPNHAKPLGNLDKALSIIKALKDDDKTFDWNRRDPYENPGPWGRFAKELRENYNLAISITICTAISYDILKKEKEWLEHENLLSNEEKKVIKYLDDLLQTSDIFSGMYFANDRDHSAKPAARIRQVLEKIDTLIGKQNKALEALKLAIKTDSDII